MKNKIKDDIDVNKDNKIKTPVVVLDNLNLFLSPLLNSSETIFV